MNQITFDLYKYLEDELRLCSTRQVPWYVVLKMDIHLKRDADLSQWRRVLATSLRRNDN